MPRPASLTDAIALVRKSGLVDDGAVRDFVARTRQRGLHGLTPASLFDRMVDESLLAPFQARQLSEGRWRGLVLGPYRLQDRIGRGGSGQVFRAEHRATRKPVAIKVLNAELVDDDIALARLAREARVSAGLDHPNIVKVVGLEADHSPPYLVMDYVDGLSLQAIVALTGPLRVESTALCGRQIAAGLSAAADAGVVHRDIKPANILLDRAGVVKILDLGIVLERNRDTKSITLVGRNHVLGTLDYVAPEQALNSHAVDHRADLYALGGTLYFLLAGHPPFAEIPPPQRLNRKRLEDPVPIHQLRPDVPVEFSGVVAKLLARAPDDRYQSAHEVVDALAPWAVPIPGFPNENFQRMHPDESSAEFRDLSGTVTMPMGRLRATGSNLSPCLESPDTRSETPTSCTAPTRPMKCWNSDLPTTEIVLPSAPSNGRGHKPWNGRIAAAVALAAAAAGAAGILLMVQLVFRNP